MTTIKAITGDTGYDLSFSLQNSDGSAFDLTGCTVTMITQLASDPDINFSNAMSIVGASGLGNCKYTVQAADFASDGTYNVQIQTVNGSKIVTFGDIQIIAAAALPLSV